MANFYNQCWVLPVDGRVKCNEPLGQLPVNRTFWIIQYQISHHLLQVVTNVHVCEDGESKVLQNNSINPPNSVVSHPRILQCELVWVNVLYCKKHRESIKYRENANISKRSLWSHTVKVLNPLNTELNPICQ